jgi:hypothetical protein
MSALALAASFGVLAGVVTLLRSSSARTAVLGLGVVLLLTPLTASPLAEPSALAFRLACGLLGTYLLRLATAGQRAELLGAPRLGGSTESIFVLAAFAVGLVAAGSGLAADPRSLAAEAGRNALAFGLGLALGLAALDLLLFGHDALRVGAGGLLGLLAAVLGYRALAGDATAPFELAAGAAIVALAATTAWLCRLALRSRGDLELGPRSADARDPG